MKATWFTEQGAPADVLVTGEMPDPQPGPGEVRLRVHACGVNYPDALMIEDKYQFRPERPFSPGAEVAGVVEAVGEGVKGVAKGDQIGRAHV